MKRERWAVVIADIKLVSVQFSRHCAYGLSSIEFHRRLIANKQINVVGGEISGLNYCILIPFAYLQSCLRNALSSAFYFFG